MRDLTSSVLAGVNIFASAPPNPRINDLLTQIAPPPLQNPPRKPVQNRHRDRDRSTPALKASHNRTKYHKPIPKDSSVIAADEHDRKVIVGDSGVSYLIPGAPFEFQFSYSETPKAKPLAIREPAFLPFEPPSMPRPWTGKAPLKSKKEKELKKQRRIRLVNDPDAESEDEGEPKVMKMARAVPGLVQRSTETRSREEILGKPLSRLEIKALVKPFLSDNRQVNLGRDGLTHNMLELIHTHWRREKVCKVRCRGVPTVDMDNVCRHLEEKTGGEIIFQIGGVVYLFRGRNYDIRTRPRFPIMLWKPATPVYPKLIQEVPEGLTRLEAEQLRKKGKSLAPICKLAKNGIYITLVRNVRDAFEESSLVKIDCAGLHASDYKKIGAKLKELVPCVLLSFDDDQILIWRGKDWKSKYPKPLLLERASAGSPHTSEATKSKGKEAWPGRLLLLWRRAVEAGTALVLPKSELSPDSLLRQVELFETSSQAADHSFSAVISATSSTSDEESNEDGSDVDDDVDDDEELLTSSVPLGSLPVDSLSRYLHLD
ncbi:RNA-binding CRS1 / YhbY (CRM) domain-containing protein [Wolffia australiana]